MIWFNLAVNLFFFRFYFLVFFLVLLYFTNKVRRKNTADIKIQEVINSNSFNTHIVEHMVFFMLEIGNFLISTQKLENSARLLVLKTFQVNLERKTSKQWKRALILPKLITWREYKEVQTLFRPRDSLAVRTYFWDFVSLKMIKTQQFLLVNSFGSITSVLKECGHCWTTCENPFSRFTD